MSEDVKFVPIGQVVESKKNPRKTLDPALEKDLVQSVISSGGIITPILVRPMGPGIYHIVDGARRYRALEVQLISFTQRVDIHPLDEAAAYEELSKKKFDIAQISAKVGKPHSYIAKRMQLVNLIEAAQTALRKGQITLGHALELARVDPSAQKDLLKECLGKYNPLTLADLREQIHDEVLISLDSASFPTDDAKLLPKAGACTVCPKRSGNNVDLFGDISRGNHCLDGKCFNAKIDAFFELKKAEAEGKGQDLIRISDGYNARKGSGAIGTDKYHVVAKKEATRQGIFVDGPQRGQIVPIRLASEKSSGDGSGSREPGQKLSKSEMNQRYKRRVEIWQNKIEQAARVLLYNKIILQVRWPLSRKEFELLIGNLFKRFDGAPLDMICKAAGIKPPSGNIWNVQEWIEKTVKKLTDQQVCQVAIGAVLWDELIQDPSNHPPEYERFEAMLSVHKKVEPPAKKKVKKSVKKQTTKRKTKKTK